MTEEFVKELIRHGLSEQQARSKTAEKMADYFTTEAGGAVILDEAGRQVDEMERMCEDMRRKHDSIARQMETVTGTLQAIREVQEEYGDVTEEKAKNAIALYAGLISVARKAGADGADAVENASYILYAYLGGQAARNINTNDGERRAHSEQRFSEWRI